MVMYTIYRSLRKSPTSKSFCLLLRLIKPLKESKLLKKVIKISNVAVFIKKNAKITKFKVRRGKYIYTFQTDKVDVIKRLTESLDTNTVEKVEIKKKRVVAKKAK
jgi:hypothetical protein